MCLPKGIRNINYTGLWDTHYVDGRLFVSYHLIIPLIFWGRFSAYVSTVSHTTGPCWITPSKKVNGSVGWQCTWETLNEHSQYFSRAAGALCSMALTKKQHKPLGIHRFVCNTQDWEKKKYEIREILHTRCYDSKAYFGQNATLWWNTGKYRLQEISFDQQM